MKLQKITQRFYISQIRALSFFSQKKAAQYAFDLFCRPHTRVQYKPSGYLKKAEVLNMKFKSLKTTGYRYNRGGSKKICIAHGFRSSAVNFQHFAKHFADKGYEVVAFDAPAHGMSQGHKLNAVMYKQFIEEVNKRFGPFDGYLCHSFGGLAVCLAVAEMPHNELINIALVAPASDTLSLCNMFFSQMKITDKKLQQYFINEIETLGKKPINWFSVKRCMETLKSKVLWIHDEGDRVTPVNDAKLIQELKYPNIEFFYTKELGHRKIYRDEQVISKLVEFL